MPLNKDKITAVILEKLEDFKPLAENLGRSRFMVYQSEYGKNEKEISTMNAIADSFRCDIVQNGSSYTLMFYMDENDPGGYLEIIDAGMPTPLLGGDGGVAHNPDGSTYYSEVPAYLWGNPADDPEDLAKPASGVIHEIKTMLKDLFHQYFTEAVGNSKKEIMEITKQYVKERLSEVVK